MGDPLLGCDPFFTEKLSQVASVQKVNSMVAPPEIKFTTEGPAALPCRVRQGYIAFIWLAIHPAMSLRYSLTGRRRIVRLTETGRAPSAQGARCTPAAAHRLNASSA